LEYLYRGSGTLPCDGGLSGFNSARQGLASEKHAFPPEQTPKSQYRAGMHDISMAAEVLKMPIKGMTCANCAQTVEKRLASTPGVTKVQVDLQGEIARVEYDSGLVKPEVLNNAVRDLGYEVPHER
jgi:Cu+-exporting ATPase